MAKKPTTPLTSISLVLLRDVNQPDDAIDANLKPDSVALDASVLPDATMYYRKGRLQPAGWWKFMAPSVPAGVGPLQAQHPDAVIVFKVGREWFAAIFGYGRSLLADAAVEPDFGFQTAVRMCDPDDLKVLEARTIETRSRYTRVKVSENGKVGAFHLDVDTDLLRGIAGCCKDKSLCERVEATGPAINVAARATISDLPAVAKHLRKARKLNLPDDLKWTDKIRRIEDRVQIDALDKDLEDRLRAGTFEKIRLSMPDVREDDVVVVAKFLAEGGERFTPEPADYLALRTRPCSSLVDRARTDHVHLVSENNGKSLAHYSVYRCMVVETTTKNGLFMLIEGNWHHIDTNYAATIRGKVSKLKPWRPKSALPSWDINTWANDGEGGYNDDLCKATPAYALLDKKNIKLGKRYSAIEPADFLTLDRHLVHVKRLDRSSSGLSHAFAQGTVSADLLRNEPEFGKRLAQKLPTTHSALAKKIQAARFDPAGWTIVYLILGADTKKPGDDLPFFSQVNLCKQMRAVKNMGYECLIAGA